MRNTQNILNPLAHLAAESEEKCEAPIFSMSSSSPCRSPSVTALNTGNMKLKQGNPHLGLKNYQLIQQPVRTSAFSSTPSQLGLQKSRSSSSKRTSSSRTRFTLERKRNATECADSLSTRENVQQRNCSSPGLKAYHSSPTIYSSNGLKRNKSNELQGSFNHSGLIERGNLQPNMFLDKQQNATFALLPSHQMHLNQPKNLSIVHEQNPFIARLQPRYNSELEAARDLLAMSRRAQGMKNQNQNMKREQVKSSSRPERKIATVASSVSRAVSSPCLFQEENKSEVVKVQKQESTSPQDTLVAILQEAGYKAEGKKYCDLENYFAEYTEEERASYGKEVISAIRSQDIPLLRELQQNGKSLHTSNQFGESLLHMACRRGFIEVVKFLLDEGKVSLRVKDDYGRTPFHDACWTAEPNFDLMALLMEKEADLLLVKDKRGHYPFSYARRNHYEQWSNFLRERKGNIHLQTFK